MERYCADRSAEYEWRLIRDGGSLIAKQCFLYGSPELARAWAQRSQAFLPQSPGGVMALQQRHGWSFIRIPGRWDPGWKLACKFVYVCACVTAVERYFAVRFCEQKGQGIVWQFMKHSSHSSQSSFAERREFDWPTWTRVKSVWGIFLHSHKPPDCMDSFRNCWIWQRNCKCGHTFRLNTNQRTESQLLMARL